MPESEGKDPKKRPANAGRKGGRRFPQYALNHAVKWADKLVSKTHGGPQPEDLIMAGVVEAKSGTANMRVSALKQFNLMEGTSKGYSATDLAKEIKSAPDNEKQPLYLRAALSPDIFGAIYETFQGDTVSTAKVRQRASDLQVHPDLTSKCAEIYIDTMEFAGLLSRNGDLLVHASKGEAAPLSEERPDPDVNQDNLEPDPDADDIGTAAQDSPGSTATRRGVATVQVNINLDSSLDTDKLQKQLELLRRYGAL